MAVLKRTAQVGRKAVKAVTAAYLLTDLMASSLNAPLLRTVSERGRRAKCFAKVCYGCFSEHYQKNKIFN